MRRAPASLLSIALLLGACGQAPAPTAAPRADAGIAARAVPGRLIVKWKRPEAAQAVLRKLGVARAETLGPEGLAPGTGAPEVIVLPAGASEAAFRAAAGDAVEWVEPDHVLRLVVPAATAEDDAGPDLGVPSFGAELHEGGKKAGAKPARQWALEKVRAAEAWKVTRGSAAVRIGVVDTGADLGHPELRGQIADSWRASGWLGRLGLASAKDDSGHGTHCAGVAAAAGLQGVSGMAPGCKLLIAKALDQDGAGATSDVVRGIRWAVAGGARVLSLSMGGEEDNRALRAAIADALAAGVVVVAAMGNEGKQLKNYPAAYPGVIAVAATTRQDKLASFSTRGAWVSVAAPGAAILSTTPTYPVAMGRGPDAEIGLGSGTLSGTSMATPMVAGLAALLLSKHPGWKPAQVKAAIERGAVALGGGTNARTGHGRIDAARTMGAR